MLKQVAGGEKLFGMVVDFMAIREKDKGAPVAFVFPKEGVSAIGEPVAILKSTKNPDAARAFVAFLLSREGQELALKQGYMPAHPQVALPAGFPDRARHQADGVRSRQGAGRREAQHQAVHPTSSVHEGTAFGRAGLDRAGRATASSPSFSFASAFSPRCPLRAC